MKKKILLSSFFGVLTSVSLYAQVYYIDNYAGGVCTGASAQQFPLYRPDRICTDNSGNLFFSDNDGTNLMKLSLTGVISKVAGNGIAQYSGDGGAATNAGIGRVSGICIDNAGNIYFTDRQNQVVRKVNTAGIITTVAGNGAWGNGGDGGPAINASFKEANGIAIDKAGNLYVSDAFDYKIRMIDPSGIISTFIGTGNKGSSGDGGSATVAEISRVADICLDPTSSHLYLADFDNHKIRKVNLASGIITTVAGTGGLGYSGDGTSATACDLGDITSVFCDANSEIYMTFRPDMTSPMKFNRLCKVNSSGKLVTLAYSPSDGYSGDGGSANQAQIAQPSDVLLDHSGNVLFVEFTNHVIRKINSSNIISTLVGNPSLNGYCGNNVPALQASLSKVHSLCIDDQNNLYFSESGRVRKIDNQGIIRDFGGIGNYNLNSYTPSGDGGQALASNLNFHFTTLDNNGNLYGGDGMPAWGSAVRKINSSGVISRFAGSYSTTASSGDGGSALNAYFLEADKGVYDNSTNSLLVIDRNRIRRINSNGTIQTICGNGTEGHSGDNGLALAATISPRDICVDKAGNIYLLEWAFNWADVRKISTNGIITRVAGTGIL